MNETIQYYSSNRAKSVCHLLYCIFGPAVQVLNASSEKNGIRVLHQQFTSGLFSGVRLKLTCR